MNSKFARVLALLALAAALPACGNINDGRPLVTFTTRVSVSSLGRQSNQNSGFPKVSGNGRYVVFPSDATNLVPGDTNGLPDIFRHDLLTGRTERVSVGSIVPPLGTCSAPSVSDDGRFVAFQSRPAFGQPSQVYVRDMDGPPGGGLVVASAVGIIPGELDSGSPAISGDGRYVAFASAATSFDPAHLNGAANIYRRDLAGTEILLISVGPAGDPTPDFIGSDMPSISADGSVIAFVSDCTDLSALDLNFELDVYVATVDALGAVTVVLASHTATGEAGTGESISPSLSADGAFVAFESEAYDLIEPDTNLNVPDIYVTRLSDLSVQRVSVNSAGFQTDAVGSSRSPSISGDGRYVAFQSFGENLVVGDGNGTLDIFVKDLQTGAIVRASVDSAGAQSTALQGSQAPSISSDGRTVAFMSAAAFARDDDNLLRDVYVRSPLR